MSAHAGLLSVEGIADEKALLEIQEEHLRLYVGNDLVGEWPRHGAVIETAWPDRIEVRAGEDAFTFRAADHSLLILDLDGQPLSLSARIAQIRPARQEPPTLPSEIAPGAGRRRDRRRSRDPRMLAGGLGLSVGLGVLIYVWMSALSPPAESSGLVATTTSQPIPTTNASVTSVTAVAALVEDPRSAEEVLGTVVSVTDGDTLRVLLAGGEEPVRLIGIDAAEPGEPTAEEAAALLTALVDGKEMRLVLDTRDRDSFGRLLRYVFVGETFVNEELVRAGLAVARRYPPDVSMAERLEAAQEEAQARGLGIWSAPNTTLGTIPQVTTTAVPATEITVTTAGSGCHRSYPDFCIPSPPPDLDCSDIPNKNFTVHPPDPHGFDRDNDGVGCES